MTQWQLARTKRVFRVHCCQVMHYYCLLGMDWTLQLQETWLLTVDRERKVIDYCTELMITTLCTETLCKIKRGEKAIMSRKTPLYMYNNN